MEDIEDIVALLIPITAIVMAFGIAFWSIYWAHQKKRLQYQERQLMIEKGLTPLPVLEDARKNNTPETSLRRGIVLLFLGIGLAVGTAVLGFFMDDREFVGLVALAAAIVGFIGLGNLVYYFIARQKPEDTARTL